MRASARWHTRGRRVIYCAENPAAALLEILVHFEIEIRDLPARYRLLIITVPDDARVERISRHSLGRCSRDFNVLLNPAHQDAARIAVVQATDHVIDPRLLS
jgi:RES domain-containing protein